METEISKAFRELPDTDQNIPTDSLSKVCLLKDYLKQLKTRNTMLEQENMLTRTKEFQEKSHEETNLMLIKKLV